MNPSHRKSFTDSSLSLPGSVASPMAAHGKNRDSTRGTASERRAIHSTLPGHWSAQTILLAVVDDLFLHLLSREAEHLILARAECKSGCGPTRRAFTLVEILIVVTVLGILASVAVTAVSGLQSQTLESSARVLAADLRLAQNLAVQFNTSWSVQFDTANHTYELVHTGSADLPAARNILEGSNPSGRYIVRLNPDEANLTNGGQIVLATPYLADSETVVADVVFGPTGGTGPSRSEDTVIRLGQGWAGKNRVIDLTVSWVTGAVWINEPLTTN